MDNNGSDPKSHNGARKSSDDEDEEKIAQPPSPPPLMIDWSVLMRTIEPLPNGGVPVRIANDIITGKHDDVQLSPLPTEEAANPVVDPDHGEAAAVVDPDYGEAAAVVVEQEPVEPVNQLTEDPTKNLSFESTSSDSEPENERDEAEPVSPLPRGSSPAPPPPVSKGTGARNRLYDNPYPIVRSGRFTNLADVSRVMQEDTQRILRQWEWRNELSYATTCISGSPTDESRSMPAWQTRQREPGNIARTPPPISDDDDDDDRYSQWQRRVNELTVRTTPRETIVPRSPPLLQRPFADQTRMGTPPIDFRTCRTSLQASTEDKHRRLACMGGRREWLVDTPPPVDLRTTSKTPLQRSLPDCHEGIAGRPPVGRQPWMDCRRERTPTPPQLPRLFGMDPPRSPGVLRTRNTSPVTPQRRHSQPSTAAPPLYAGKPPRRSSVPVRHLSGMANGACGGTDLAEGGWASRHTCENEDCRSFWQHLQECGLQLPPGWYVMQHEDARGRPYAYVVQLDVGPHDMVPNLARSIMIDQHGRMQYFMYGATVDASDNSLPEQLNDLGALNEIVDVFASMNHEF